MREGIGATVAAAAWLAMAAAAPAADTVTVRAVAGQACEGTIQGAGDTHAFLLEDFAPQLFSVSLKAAKGSALVPDLFLEDPSSADATAGLAPFRRDSARGVLVRNADTLSAPGTWILRVGGQMNTTGGYSLKVTTRVTKRFRGAGVVPEVPGSPALSFFAPTGARVSLKVAAASGSALVPLYGPVDAPACVSAEALPGARPGTATLSVPRSGAYGIETLGNGGTQGAFNWIAKVKALKPPRVAVRVNGGAVYFPGDGPAPASLVARPGQDVEGFGTDGIDLVWREVRRAGSMQQLGKNSIEGSTVKGAKLPALANNFAVDSMVSPAGFGLGPDHAVAVAGGSLHLVPRGGGNSSVLAPAPAMTRRVLVTRDRVVVLHVAGIDSYDLAGNPSSVSSDGSEYLDMAFGGLGVIFAVETTGGDLVLRTAPLAGGGDTPIADLGPNPGLRAFAARGPDAFAALDDGTGGSLLHRASSCDPGNPVLLRPFPQATIHALAADEFNVYAVEDDPMDGPRVRQVPAGGGEPTVIARNNEATGYEVLGDGLAAAGGYVYFLGDDGNDGFFRVKRR